MNIEGVGTCERPNCTEMWHAACPHARLCYAHTLEHMGSDEACRLLIAEAVRIWAVRCARPLIAKLSTYKIPSLIEGIPIEESKRQMFPARVAYFEMIDALTDALAVFDESLERLRNILVEQDAGSIQLLREQHEGNDMPYSLTDGEVWQWLEDRFRQRDEEISSH